MHQQFQYPKIKGHAFNNSFYNYNQSQQRLKMFPSLMMLAHNKTHFDDEVDKMKQSISQQSSINKNSLLSNQTKRGIKTNEQFIDSSLTQTSKSKVRAIIKDIKPEECDLVIMSPLRRSYQTFMEVFADAAKVQVYIEPLLANRLENVGCIPLMSEEWKQKQLKGFHGKIDETRVNLMENWLFQILSEQKKQEIRQIMKNKGKQQKEACLTYLKDGKQLQSDAQFNERITQLKKQLMIYLSKSKRKIILISDKEIFAHLTATGQHQDYSLVNSLSFDFGTLKEQHIIIEGVIGEKTSIIPFCK